MTPPGQTPLGLTDDTFLGGKIRLLQPAQGFRSGLDAVLLAAAAPVPATAECRVLDAGSGIGAVGLSIAARCPGAHVTLVEIAPQLAELAQRNAERNDMSERVSIVVADIAQGGRAVHAPDRPEGLAPASFDHLVTNPPYFAIGAGTPPRERSKATAHQMTEGDLDRWIAFLATAGKANATLTMIHRAEALAEILQALDGRFGRIRVLPVHSRSDTNANRIIVSAIKGSRAPLEVRPGLIVHGPDGHVRPEIDGVLRHGHALDL